MQYDPRSQLELGLPVNCQIYAKRTVISQRFFMEGISPPTLSLTKLVPVPLSYFWTGIAYPYTCFVKGRDNVLFQTKTAQKPHWPTPLRAYDRKHPSPIPRVACHFPEEGPRFPRKVSDPKYGGHCCEVWNLQEMEVAKFSTLIVRMMA